MARVLVALNIPRSIPRALFYARSIAQAVASRPDLFPAPPGLAELEANIQAVADAEVVARSRLAGAATERDAKLYLVRGGLAQLRAYVENVAFTSIESAAEIVACAGMSLKRSSGHGKPAFEVKQGRTSGSVHIVVRAAPGTASYDWEYAAAGGTWTRLATTVRADTRLDGLVPGKLYSFRFRWVTKDGVGDFGDVVTLRVL